MVQWLGLSSFTAKEPGSIPKILQALWQGQRKKKSQGTSPSTLPERLVDEGKHIHGKESHHLQKMGDFR